MSDDEFRLTPPPVGEYRWNAVHFSTVTDDWETPEDLYRALDAEFAFTLDPVPLHGTDGLTCPWKGHRVYCNPPYSNIYPFLEFLNARPTPTWPSSCCRAEPVPNGSTGSDLELPKSDSFAAGCASAVPKPVPHSIRFYWCSAQIPYRGRSRCRCEAFSKVPDHPHPATRKSPRIAKYESVAF